MRNSCSGHGMNSEIQQNLRVVRSHEVGQGTKTLKSSPLLQVGRLVVKNVPGSARLADYPRWAPKRWPVDAWECRVVNSPFVEARKFVLAGGCTWEPLRSWIGWTPLLHTPSSGVWLFRGVLRGSSFLLRLCPQWTGSFRGTYRTAWAGALRCLCSYACGRRAAVGPHTGARSWELLRGLWKAIAPQLAPCCADGEMPTCANLNY